MPTKTDRILGYLPETFRPLPRPTALSAIVGAVGDELLSAENALAEVVQSHWVDHADRGADVVRDLVCLAALYGLAPRVPPGVEPLANSCCSALGGTTVPSAETVEEFREHLKRYVRTFLEGTVTVQGILRVAAETLGLPIADEWAALDPWWRRGDRDLVTRAPRGEDAASTVLGVATADAVGCDAAAAEIAGTVDLSEGVDLRPTAVLSVAVDGGTTHDVDLATAVTDPAHALLDEIIQALAVTGVVATAIDGRFLRLASPTLGLASQIVIGEGPADAAERVLGPRARTSVGKDAVAASITTIDLAGGLDLGDDRYLRVAIDGVVIREIDCAGPAATVLDRVRDRVNTAFPAPVAAHDGHRITVASPTVGATSRVDVETAGAQDAGARLFGDADRVAFGADAQPARLLGSTDLTGGVDLSEHDQLVLRIDGVRHIIGLTAVEPAKTQRAEIVAAIDTAIGVHVAEADDVSITITSPTTGTAGEVALEMAPDRDAGERVFGIPSRDHRGLPARPAALVGDGLVAPLNLMAVHLLGLRIDNRPVVEIDLRSTAENPAAVSAAELASAVNARCPGVASHQDERLVLTSPTGGAAGRIRIVALEEEIRRRFVTRAALRDAAAEPLLGFFERSATGRDATAAQVVGDVELSRGIDLSRSGYLRVSVDGAEPVDIGCAGPRPRMTLLEEVVGALNAALSTTGDNVASSDGHHLILKSPTTGARSQITLGVPRPGLDALGLEPGLTRGTDATGVVVVSTVSHSGGVDLPAGAALAVGVDGAAPVTVELTPQATHLQLDDIVDKLNAGLQVPVAFRRGALLGLASPTTGATSRIELAAAAGSDATATLLGFAAPRSYHGAPGTPARVAGTRDLAAGADLAAARRVRLAVDGGPDLEIDCAAAAGDAAHASLDEIVISINAVVPEVASTDGHHLVLTSTTEGASGQIDLQPSEADDARRALLGDAAGDARGEAAASAEIVGERDLLAPVDLSQRRTLSIAVDEGAPVDIDVAGVSAPATFVDEVVASVESALPGVASITDDDRLRLRSSTAGPQSRIAVVCRRFLEVVEFPLEPFAASRGPVAVHSGAEWTVDNVSAGEETAEILLHAPQGAVAPTFFNEAQGCAVRVAAVVSGGSSVRVFTDHTGTIVAEVRPSPGEPWIAPCETVPIGRGKVLDIPPGRGTWRYLDRPGTRFDHARFNRKVFTRLGGHEPGVFDLSVFDSATFASATDLAGHGAEVTMTWPVHRVGAFEVNLPTDLPARFGGHFNAARFARSASSPEQFPAAVTEPSTDDRFIESLINKGSPPADPSGFGPSALVTATRVPRAPLGWNATAMPFRKPAYLTLGNPTRAAALYLSEEGFGAQVLELKAREPGDWGNQIAVTARPAGPGRFDLTVLFEAGRFESARRIVAGDDASVDGAGSVKPAAVGVLQAKASGIAARVTRDGARDVWTTPASAGDGRS